MNRLTYVAVATAIMVAGCSGSAGHDATKPADHVGPVPRPPQQELFGFDTYDEPDGEAQATRIVRVDPTSLAELPLSTLKLGDATNGHLFSPDRRFLALGGMSYGEIIVVDLVGYVVSARVTVARSAGFPSAFVAPVAWPRADRLLAYTQPSAAHQDYPAQLVVVDPARRRVVTSEPLGGSVVTTAALSDGRALFLVAPVGKIGPARIVFADADGGLRTISLRETPAGFAPGSSWTNDEQPGVAVAGNEVYVVGNSDRIARVDVDSATVTYHRVRGLLSQRLLSGPPQLPGSGGVMTTEARTADWLGDGLLDVTGGDTKPVRGGTENQDDVLSAQIVDTKSWTVRRTFRGVTRIEAAHGLYYCWVLGSVPDIGSFEALRPDGTVVFRLTTPNTIWEMSDGRLIQRTDDDPNGIELDPLTGRKLLRDTAVTLEPFDLLPWTNP